MDEIACPLLQRTADTNRFLRADANAALDIMCEQLPIHRVIPVITLRGCGHQNAVVRATAVRILGINISSYCMTENVCKELVLSMLSIMHFLNTILFIFR